MLKLQAQITPPFGKADYKLVGIAVHESGLAVADALREALSGTMFPGMSRAVNDEGLRNQVVANDYGLFEFVVDVPDLSSVEDEVPAYDMKPGLLRGPRHRVNAKGQPYTIVPFRHSKKMLPPQVQSMVTRMKLSRIIGSFTETRSDDGAQVQRNIYFWGGNTGNTEDITPLRTSFTGYEHKSSLHSNMVKFAKGNLLTFRTVSASSDPLSWWHPGKPANPIADSVWTFMQPMVEGRIAEAWTEVIKTL